MTSDSPAVPRPSQAWFATTHWSVVRAAGGATSPDAEAALQKLCQTYWPPLYGYLRRRGYGSADAADLTQGFFCSLLERQSVGAVRPDRGRFRSFLLAALKHFLADEWDKAQTQKRGGGVVWVADYSVAESRLAETAEAVQTPEQAYEQQWALALLETVYQQLEREQQAFGRAPLFDALRSTLAGSGEAQPYARLAGQLGMSEGAVRVAVHRLRRRYRELLREAIAATVDHPDEIEEEFQHLRQALSGS